MIIYAVYASDYEAYWIKKAFMSKEKAEAYANELNKSYDALSDIQKEYERRCDEVWEMVYDRNGFNGEPLFEELDAWYAEQRKAVNIHPDCDVSEECVRVKEVEVEDYSSLINPRRIKCQIL